MIFEIMLANISFSVICVTCYYVFETETRTLKIHSKLSIYSNIVIFDVLKRYFRALRFMYSFRCHIM